MDYRIQSFYVFSKYMEIYVSIKEWIDYRSGWSAFDLYLNPFLNAYINHHENAEYLKNDWII